MNAWAMEWRIMAGVAGAGGSGPRKPVMPAARAAWPGGRSRQTKPNGEPVSDAQTRTSAGKPGGRRGAAAPGGTMWRPGRERSGGVLVM